MRGKERYHFAICEVYGITPAYAGKSAVLKQLQHSHMDHPRVCGEKVIRHPFPIHKRGSPPRMRGKAKGVQHGPLIRRITPAYAGKSYPAIFGPGYLRDHPRVCGEKWIASVPASGFLGSPPRMRGKDSRQNVAQRPQGITPAYAGKRPPPKSPRLLRLDHPRVCGEKENSMTLKDYHKGSPPRMRGKGSRRYGQQWSAGITPAYAGKSASCTQSRLYRWDHPRVCGEKKRSKRQHRNTAGSPPRMRGKGA